MKKKWEIIIKHCLSFQTYIKNNKPPSLRSGTVLGTLLLVSFICTNNPMRKESIIFHFVKSQLWPRQGNRNLFQVTTASKNRMDILNDEIKRQILSELPSSTYSL